MRASLTTGWRRLNQVFALVLLGLRVVSADPAGANSTIPPAERTGAPKPDGSMEGTCNEPGICHTDWDLNFGSGAIEIDVPSFYEPSQVHTITVRVAQEGQMRWGFEAVALDGTLQSVGSFGMIDSVFVQESSGREYVTHFGALGPQPVEAEWTFSWTAPGQDVGPVTFYAAGNAADGNLSNMAGPQDAGDFIYTTSEVVPLPEPGSTGLGLAALVAVGALGARRRLN